METKHHVSMNFNAHLPLICYSLQLNKFKKKPFVWLQSSFYSLNLNSGQVWTIPERNELCESSKLKVLGLHLTAMDLKQKKI